MMCFSGIAGLSDMEGHFQSHMAPFKHLSIPLFVLFTVSLSPSPYLSIAEKFIPASITSHVHYCGFFQSATQNMQMWTLVPH